MSDVDHLFRHLVEVLSAEDPERLDGPIQISELYKTILPYRSYKSVLHFDTNQDYEMAMLQLLAGDGGYASVEPVEVRDALVEEVRAINPNPGVFRDYAAARVRFDREAVQSAIDAGQAYAPPADSAAARPHDPYAPPIVDLPANGAIPTSDALVSSAPVDTTAPHEPGPVRTGAGGTAPSPHESPTAPTFIAADRPSLAPPTTSFQEDPAVCPFCEQSLPTGRTVIFCPFCGGRVVPIKCTNCGDELESDWRYCPACGSAAPES